MTCHRFGMNMRLRTTAALLVAMLAVGAQAPPARAQVPLPNPCDLPGTGLVCDVAGQLAGRVAGAAGDFVMRGVTVWVTNAAVWVTGKVGDLIDSTASPNVEAAWFVTQYRSMVAVAGVLALPLLLLAVMQALMRQDIWVLLRAAFGYLPMAFILAAAAVVGTHLLIEITDDLSAIVTHGLGGKSDGLLKSVGQAYKHALDDNSADAIPLFGIFLGAIILAIGAFVLWLEMVIRDAAIYIALFFIPLSFVAMIWPATSRYARRLVEFLIGVVLAKFVIVAIISLASAAITNAGGGPDDGHLFERMIAGAALLVLAAWSPFALLRLLPMMEIAATSVIMQRSSMSGAATSAGVQSPAAYMRQAMDRHSRASASPAYPVASGTTYSRVERSEHTSSSATRSSSDATRDTRSDRETFPSSGASGATYGPRERTTAVVDQPPGKDTPVRTEPAPPGPRLDSEPRSRQPQRPPDPPPTEER